MITRRYRKRYNQRYKKTVKPWQNDISYTKKRIKPGAYLQAINNKESKHMYAVAKKLRLYTLRVDKETIIAARKKKTALLIKNNFNNQAKLGKLLGYPKKAIIGYQKRKTIGEKTGKYPSEYKRLIRQGAKEKELRYLDFQPAGLNAREATKMSRIRKKNAYGNPGKIPDALLKDTIIKKEE